MSFINKNRIISIFTFYLFFSIIFPLYHCHESNGSHLKPFFKDECCELHGKDSNGSHNHHAHFLIADIDAFAKSRYNIKSIMPLKWLALPEIVYSIKTPLSEKFLHFISKKIFYQEYFHSFSGLSPPLV